MIQRKKGDKFYVSPQKCSLEAEMAWKLNYFRLPTQKVLTFRLFQRHGPFLISE